MRISMAYTRPTLMFIRDLWDLPPNMHPRNRPQPAALHVHNPKVAVTEYIPTAGEHAGLALASFITLQNAASLPELQKSSSARAAAIEFVHACLALMRKFPAQ